MIPHNMNSTSTQMHEKLVLSRKLNPSEKQRRKQLIAEANKSAKNLTDNNFLLKRKTNFTGQTAESFSCLGRNSDANINARPGKDQVDHSKKSSQLGKKPSIDLIDTVVWPVKTRTRIFLPFFEWYGGKGSNSQRKVIIKEQEGQERTEGNNTQNEDSSIIGRGQFSRVIRCRIKEESRTGQTFSSGSPQTTIPNVETTDSVETNDFSQEIALKIINKSAILSEPELIRQLCQERRIHEVCSKPVNNFVNAVAKSSCPDGILPLLRAWQDDLHLYMAFPLCDQGSLYDMWAKTCREHHDVGFTSLTILLLVHQIGSALDHIHNVGVIHRDVKMENILLGADGNLKLTDFGLAKWLGRRQRTGTICGTLSYMAPEVMNSGKKSSLWSGW